MAEQISSLSTLSKSSQTLIVKNLRNLKIVARATGILLKEACKLAYASPRASLTLHDLSDQQPEGILATRDARRECFPTAFPACDMDKRAYRLLEVAIAGLVSCLQEAYVLEWQLEHKAALQGLNVSQAINRIESILGDSYFAQFLAGLQEEHACMPVDANQGPFSLPGGPTYRDMIFGELIERMQGGANVAPLNTFGVTSYAALLVMGYEMSDSKGLQILLEFFSDHCDSSVLLKLPYGCVKVNTCTAFPTIMIDFNSNHVELCFAGTGFVGNEWTDTAICNQ